MFIYAGLTKQPDLVSNSIIVMTLGYSTLIGRKIVNGSPKLEDIPTNNTDDSQKDLGESK
jgi:hypothetical protein